MPREKAFGHSASRILDVAERLVQLRGFNGFSYADVAAELNVTKASLHYHFAGKAELGEALIVRYGRRFADALAAIDDTDSDARGALEAYAALYAEVLRDQRMCLCGMLAAEYQTLPKPMQQAVIRFFDENVAWLENVLARGQADGVLGFGESPREAARLVVSALEGAMLTARPYGDVDRFQAAANALLSGLASAAATKA
jgi:TetR/AcrR family transcriptional regulator, transcriptional repressor for nem operon